MTLERKLASALSMDDAAWLRHANPWSVWTRATVLPLVILAVWSRHWLGMWSWVAISASIARMWANPRVFYRPKSMSNWASRGVTAIGAVFVAWGLIELAVWPALLGSVLVYCGKLWFLDRMVWLYEVMLEQHEQYRAWLD